MNREQLQRDLLDVFEKHGIVAAVGLTASGVAIRSQDDRLDATNLGPVVPFHRGVS